MLFPRASLKRSPRIRTRKNTTSADVDIVCPPPSTLILVRRKSRPPPLQIIPELSENEFDNATHSPATARPMQCTPQQPEASRITLSAYTFSIDDALLMFGGDAPRSPALSASSSTSDGASSEDVPTTPRTSDNDDGYDFMLPTPCLRPQRISIRPLRIAKTSSLICQEDVGIHNYCETEEKNVFRLPVTEEIREHLTEAKAATAVAEEAEQDFYARELEDFITIFPAIPSPISPTRRDSLILAAEALPSVIEIAETKPRGRSRHSKPLPLLPPVTPPISTFPLVSTLPLVQTTAHKSIARRKRNIQPVPNYPPPPPPGMSRPLPRMSIPLDIDDCAFPEESLDALSRGSIFVEHVEEDASIYSQPSLTCTVSTNACPLPPAIPETPLSGMYGEVTLPRSSTDSDAPRSSVDSISSFTSSASSDICSSPFSFPSSPSEERLRSRWSTSTFASVAIEPPRSTTLLSPLRSVFGSRTRRVFPPPRKVPPQLPKSKHGLTTTPSPPSTLGKHIRRHRSRSSTSSAGTNSSECDSRDGSPNGLKRKPIPMAMFLRAT